MAGGPAAFIAACGAKRGSPTATTATTTGASADVAILNLALDVENLAIAAYAGGAKLLRGPLLKLGKEFLLHEREHASGLSEAIKQLGGTPNKAKPSYNFPKLVSQKDVLRLASKIENTAIAAYIDAIPKLSTPDLRATAAAIVTNEAEHLAVLQGALKRPQTPTAFVIGKP